MNPENHPHLKLFAAWDQGPVLSPSAYMVGSSAAFQKLEKELRSAAQWEGDPVLLVGERGTGKELAAKALHAWSRRRGRKLLAISMPALHNDLLADELFGHERHAYTGATECRKGAFAEADRGTLFLDEIADLTPTAQAGLLRVIDTGEVKPIGANLPFRVNVRLITATNQDLQKLVRDGKFRADLYDRLRAFEIRVPPLRERLEDIPMLAGHFLRECCEEHGCALGKSREHRCRKEAPAECVEQSFCQMLLTYSWPGNIRDLRRIVRRSRSNHPHAVLDQSHIRLLIEEEKTSCLETCENADRSLDGNSRTHIAYVLKLCAFNISRTAVELGIPRTTLRDKIKRLKIFSGSTPTHI
jgi:DNA-binding NtrC family response regulator